VSNNKGIDENKVPTKIFKLFIEVIVRKGLNTRKVRRLDRLKERACVEKIEGIYAVVTIIKSKIFHPPLKISIFIEK